MSVSVMYQVVFSMSHKAPSHNINHQC